MMNSTSDRNTMRGLEESWTIRWPTFPAIRTGNGRGTTSREGEIHSLAEGDVANLLLLELLQKENEQIQRQSEQL